MTVKLNLELACDSEVLAIALQVHPDQATLVPERREELTTEGGLDVTASPQTIGRAIERLRQAEIEVSLFLDPDPQQIQAAADLGAQAVELHTGSYALGRGAERQAELSRLAEAGRPGPRIGPDPARRAWTDLFQRATCRSSGGHV